MKTKKLIALFEKVQQIPYKVCKFDEGGIHPSLKEGDCRHKAVLLKKLLEHEGFEVKKLSVVFDWGDLPLPQEMLGILKSGTVWDHHALTVNVNGKWIKVDCTWDPALAKIGFPVTKDWNGVSDTQQVTEGSLEFYDSDGYVRNEKEIKIVKGEAYAFAEALNDWMRGGKK